MSVPGKKSLSIFRIRNVLIPVFIGFSVTLFFILKDFNKTDFQDIHWCKHCFIWIIVAILMECIRDLAYMYRIWLLTDKKITFKRSFFVIMLWEFASAVTPTIVGGTAAALYIVNREGIKMGKTTAIVLITAILDELFFILIVPLLFLFISQEVLFVNSEFQFLGSDFDTRSLFLIGYIIILCITSFFLYGIFINPGKIKKTLLQIFKLPFLRKWRDAAGRTGDDIIITSKELKTKPFVFWIKAFIATVGSWLARYLTVNFLILAFISTNDQLIIIARQLIMWVILLVTPTPGSSGVAEFGFMIFLGEFLPHGLSSSIALLWRILSYYPYIIIGGMILPAWLRRVYKKEPK
ncbi:YbhN family protein [Bacteroidota bacterium]